MGKIKLWIIKESDICWELRVRDELLIYKRWKPTLSKSAVIVRTKLLLVVLRMVIGKFS